MNREYGVAPSYVDIDFDLETGEYSWSACMEDIAFSFVDVGKVLTFDGDDTQFQVAHVGSNGNGRYTCIIRPVPDEEKYNSVSINITTN